MAEDQIDTQDAPVAEEAKADTVDEMQVPMYNKIQMADVVKREKAKAYERGKREMLENMQAQQQPVAQQQQPAMQQAPQQAAPQSMGGMQQMSPEQIRQMIAEQTPQILQQQAQNLQAQQSVQGFVSKMEAAEARYPGLKEKLGKLDYTHMGPVIKLLNETDNAGDIMKELVDNPMKMGNLLTLAHTQPQIAAQAMNDLSNSIKQNQQAQAQESSSNEPLDRITPSNVGSDSGSKGSVRDFKTRYRG